MLDGGVAVHHQRHVEEGPPASLRQDHESLLPGGLNDPLALFATGLEVLLDRGGSESLQAPHLHTRVVQVGHGARHRGLDEPDDVTGAVDPGAQILPGLDHLRLGEDRLGPGRRVVDGRDPVRELGDVLPVLLGQDLGVEAREMMGVGVDESRHDGFSGDVDNPRAGGRLDFSGSADGFNPVAVHQDVAPLDDPGVPHGDDPGATQEHLSGGQRPGRRDLDRDLLGFGIFVPVHRVLHGDPIKARPPSPGDALPPVGPIHEVAAFVAQLVDRDLAVLETHRHGIPAGLGQRGEIDLELLGEGDPSAIGRRNDIVGQPELQVSTAIGAVQPDRGEVVVFRDKPLPIDRLSVVDAVALGVEDRPNRLASGPAGAKGRDEVGLALASGIEPVNLDLQRLLQRGLAPEGAPGVAEEGQPGPVRRPGQMLVVSRGLGQLHRRSPVHRHLVDLAALGIRPGRIREPASVGRDRRRVLHVGTVGDRGSTTTRDVVTIVLAGGIEVEGAAVRALVCPAQEFEPDGTIVDLAVEVHLFGQGLLEACAEGDHGGRVGPEIVAPDLAVRRVDDTAAVRGERVAWKNVPVAESLLLVPVHEQIEHPLGSGPQIPQNQPLLGVEATTVCQPAPIGAHRGAHGTAVSGRERVALPGLPIEALDRRVLEVGAIEVDPATIRGRSGARRRFGLVDDLDPRAPVDVVHVEVVGEALHQIVVSEGQHILPVRSPIRRLELSVGGTRASLGIAPVRVGDPHLVGARLVGDVDDAGSVRREAGLLVVGRAARDGSGLTPGNGKGIEIPEKIEDQSLSIRRHIHRHPGPFLEGDFEREGGTVDLLDGPLLRGLLGLVILLRGDVGADAQLRDDQTMDGRSPPCARFPRHHASKAGRGGADLQEVTWTLVRAYGKPDPAARRTGGRPCAHSSCC